MRSIGETTQIAAIASATLARRGTRGSRRSRHIVVAQAGSIPARSFIVPGGSLRAIRTSTAQLASSITTPTNATVSQDTRRTYASFVTSWTWWIGSWMK